jgi:hypothetical protein
LGRGIPPLSNAQTCVLQIHPSITLYRVKHSEPALGDLPLSSSCGWLAKTKCLRRLVTQSLLPQSLVVAFSLSEDAWVLALQKHWYKSPRNLFFETNVVDLLGHFWKAPPRLAIHLPLRYCDPIWSKCVCRFGENLSFLFCSANKNDVSLVARSSARSPRIHISCTRMIDTNRCGTAEIEKQTFALCISYRNCKERMIGLGEVKLSDPRGS